MDKLVIERSILINAPCEQVWDALTNPDKMAQWFVPNLPGAELKRDDKGKVTIHMGPMAVDFVILDMSDAPRQVTSHSLPDQSLDVTFKLVEQSGGTQVTVSVSGFESLADNTRKDRLELVGAGWDKALQNLKAFVDGAALPFPQAPVGPLFGYWREPNQKLAIERSIWIDAPRERVWRAITNPKQIQSWFSPNTVWQLSALEIGGRFFVHNAEDNGEMYVEIIDVLNPYNQLVTRTVPEPPDTVVKTKAYTLIEENQGTRLIVTLTGYEPESDDTRWNHMEQDAFGFGMMLQNTKAYIEGKELPFPMGF
ncbi:MAG: SRPBCC family protein [Chloroflexota bacterium]